LEAILRNTDNDAAIAEELQHADFDMTELVVHLKGIYKA
jgi:hypothetical protein